MNHLRSILAAVTICAVGINANAVDLTYDWGPAETVADHYVGPGMKYTKVIYPNKPVILWLVEIDLENEYAKVEHVQSRHQVPDPLRWDVMTHYRENTHPGHKVKVAWNHDFFVYESGVCIGLNISEGEVTWSKWGRSLLAITEDRKAEVFYPELDAFVTAPDGTSVVIDYFNSHYGGVSGDCLLYNRMNGKELTEEGRYFALKPLDKWAVNGDPVRCVVTEVSNSPLATNPDGSQHVLFLHNSKLTALDGHVAVNDTLKVTQRFTEAGWGIKPKNILNAFHGYPSIVHDGVLHEGEFNNFENGREYEKSSRVMAGLSKDKTKLYIVTTEMSPESVGVDCIELCAWMVERGSWDIVNFDSGGSAAIVIDEIMLNKPGRGAIRPVQDAALAVSLAPEDSITDHLTFSLGAIEPMIVSRTPLRVLSFNRYNEILDDDLKDCDFECVPSTIGYVDKDGVFHSSEVCSEGKIIARKDGKEAVLNVRTKDIESVTPVYNALLTDNCFHPICGIIGKSEGLEVEVDPGALDWSTSNEGIIEINDGMIRGLANGTTKLSARFKDLTLEIDITVEISEPFRTAYKCADLADGDITKSSSVKNLVVSKADTRWPDGLSMKFDLSSGRGTNIRITPKTRLYSLPDSLSLNMLDRDGIVTSIGFYLTDAQGQRLTYTNTPAPGQTTHTIAFATPEDPIEYHRFPLTLNYINLYLSGSPKPETGLELGTIDGYYPGYVNSVNTVFVDNASPLSVRIEGETLYVAHNSAEGEKDAGIAIYTAGGRLIGKSTVRCDKGQNCFEIDIKHLPTGIYILTLQTGTGVQTAKFAVK